MTNLEVQSYLRKPHNNLQTLKEEYGISYNFHKTFPNLVGLCYRTPSFEYPIARECRGLVLDINDNYNVVARTYDKFFNYGEKFAPDLNLKDCQVYEKLDGTMIGLYHYRDRWFACTTGTPDASGLCETWRGDFASLFFRVFRECNYTHPSTFGEEAKDWTFIFELCTPYNQVVVEHSKNKLILHSARNIKTGEYLHPEQVKEKFSPYFNWEIVSTLPTSSTWEGLQGEVEFFYKNPKEHEGVVIVHEKTFERVKFKTKEYVLLHHALTNFSLNTALEVFFKGQSEIDEVVAYKPELSKIFSDIQFGYDVLSEYACSTLENTKTKFGDDRKAIGLYFNQTKYLKNPVINFAKGWVFKKLFDSKYEDVDFQSYLKQEYKKAPKVIKYLLLEAK